jgi:CheY-like chemotaxis protein
LLTRRVRTPRLPSGGDPHLFRGATSRLSPDSKSFVAKRAGSRFTSIETCDTLLVCEGVAMLRILVVEDDCLFAETLRHMIELNPRYVVTAVADDAERALAAVEERRPDLALVDLRLARGSTGFSVAAKLGELGIPCLFTTGSAPSFPLPDLALGCLAKPFSEEDLVRTLKAAEDMLRGRECLRPSRPSNLRIYSEEEDAGHIEPVPGENTSAGVATIKRKLEGWWSSRQSGLEEAATPLR